MVVQSWKFAEVNSQGKYNLSFGGIHPFFGTYDDVIRRLPAYDQFVKDSRIRGARSGPSVWRDVILPKAVAMLATRAVGGRSAARGGKGGAEILESLISNTIKQLTAESRDAGGSPYASAAEIRAALKKGRAPAQPKKQLVALGGLGKKPPFEPTGVTPPPASPLRHPPKPPPPSPCSPRHRACPPPARTSRSSRPCPSRCTRAPGW